MKKNITIDQISSASSIDEHKAIIENVVQTTLKGLLRAYNDKWDIKYQKEYLCALHEAFNINLKNVCEVVRISNNLIKQKIAVELKEREIDRINVKKFGEI